jgi:hypothetical protein
MTHAATPSRRRRTDRAPDLPRGRRWELLALLELSALCGLAIAQPLLDATGRAPDFFLFHRAGRADILLLAAVIAVAPPLLLWCAGTVTRLAGARVRRAVHALTVGALSTALAVQAGKWLLPLRGLPLAALALAAGLLAAAAYLRWTVPARLLRIAAIGPLVSVLLFVFASPTGAVVLGGRGGAGSAPGRVSGAHPPIVVIVLDELPQATLLDDAGRLDAARFPGFARLAADATWYRNATTVAGVTPYAVPSLLTGRYPPSTPVAPHYSAYPENLFSLLAGVYEMRVQESVVQLCAPRVCGGDATPKAAGQGLPALLSESASLMTKLASPNDTRDDPMAEWTEPVDTAGASEDGEAAKPLDVRFRWRRFYQNQPVRFNRFVDGLSAEQPSPPTLHFLHLLLPHQPFHYLPSGARYERPRKPLPTTGDWWASLTRQRHLAQARYTDRLLAMALGAMRESGLYDRALVVVTADHGIAFTPAKASQRRIDETQRDAAGIGWVPLFIKAPGQREARMDARNWLHVDLLPTIADYAGVQPPWPVDGRSAVREPRTSTDKPYSWQPARIGGGWDVGPRLNLDPGHAATVLAGADDVTPLPAPPLPKLAGRRVADLPVTDARVAASVPDLDRFRAVEPGGTVPALVLGTVPATVRTGSRLAIAVNGTIGAVVPVVDGRGDAPRFAGLITDDSVFTRGKNSLDLYLVDAGGTGLARLTLRG